MEGQRAMNRELKKKWIDALRSGEYPQTTGKLQRTCPHIIYGRTDAPPGYCCLGVLCKVADVEFRPDFDHLLPEGFEISLNVRRSLINELISMNDEGVPFNKIADYIEENIPIDDEAAQD